MSVGPSPGADRCEPMPCGAKRFGIDCGRHGITPALLHAMRTSIEFARARVLQASQRMTVVTRSPSMRTGGLVVPRRKGYRGSARAMGLKRRDCNPGRE